MSRNAWLGLMVRYRTPVLVLAAMLSIVGAEARAQDLRDEIVVSLPPQTVRIEFANLDALRQLAGYDKLRQRFVGPRLVALERSLGQLGLGEQDIKELALAWQPTGELSLQVDVKDAGGDGGIVANTWPAYLDGLATGHFEMKEIAEHARDKHIATMSFDGRTAYCLQTSTSTCVVFLNQSLAVFGTRKSLLEILGAREGVGANLVSSPRLLTLLQGVSREASIWGIAIGPAAAEWFQGWLPGSGDLHLDWRRMLAPVESFQYSVETDDKLRLNLRLECKTTEAAVMLGQLLQGVRLVQQFVWQTERPNRMNPVQSWEVKIEGERVSVSATTSHEALVDQDIFPPRP